MSDAEWIQIVEIVKDLRQLAAAEGFAARAARLTERIDRLETLVTPAAWSYPQRGHTVIVCASHPVPADANPLTEWDLDAMADHGDPLVCDACDELLA